MKYRIQNLVLPREPKHRQCVDLFYRGCCGFVDEERGTLSFGYGQKCDFVTYLNACSWEKWRKYTVADKLSVEINIEGKCSIIFLGYHLESDSAMREEFGRVVNVETDGIRHIEYQYPENNETMVGFEITGMGECTLHDASYYVEVDESQINPTVLSLATTTCKKEEYITENVRLLQKEIMDSDDDMKNSFYIHVIDNGNTLKDEDVSGYHTILHPNPNLGGSGGFSRGMYESLHQTPKATNVLLMDDDVLVLPESIRRIYRFLCLQKVEYKEFFISGAMLLYEEPAIQLEDIGTITPRCLYHPLKPNYHHGVLENNLRNEQYFAPKEKMYAAWWCCTIPATQIEKNGYSMPIFIRLDDSEYSIRCKARFISMNGICIWHMGFESKFSASSVYYQQTRNTLIVNAASGTFSGFDVEKFIKDSFMFELCTFNYNAAKLVIRGVEDYLKGPDFLKNEDLLAHMQEAAKLNETLYPYDQIKGTEQIYNWWDCFINAPRKITDKVWFHLTDNGHRFTPKFMYRGGNEPVAVVDPAIAAQRVTRHDHVIAVNPKLAKASHRYMDKKKYKEVKQYYRTVMKEYHKNNDKIMKQYKREFKYLVSEDFWKGRWS